MNWKHKYPSPYVVPMVISFVPLMSFHVWKEGKQLRKSSQHWSWQWGGGGQVWRAAETEPQTPVQLEGSHLAGEVSWRQGSLHILHTDILQVYVNR